MQNAKMEKVLKMVSVFPDFLRYIGTKTNKGGVLHEKKVCSSNSYPDDVGGIG